MQLVDLVCEHCRKEFQRPKKEVTYRLKKKGTTRVYCSLKCSGHASVGHLDPYSPENLERLRNNQSHATECAKKANRKYTLAEVPFQEHLRRVMKRKTKSFDLDLPYVMELWEKQGGRCALSGIPMKQIGETTDKNFLASLDRIDSSKGYLKGNVQFVVCAMNWAKGPRRDDEVRHLISLIKQYA